MAMPPTSTLPCVRNAIASVPDLTRLEVDVEAVFLEQTPLRRDVHRGEFHDRHVGDLDLLRRIERRRHLGRRGRVGGGHQQGSADKPRHAACEAHSRPIHTPPPDCEIRDPGHGNASSGRRRIAWRRGISRCSLPGTCMPAPAVADTAAFGLEPSGFAPSRGRAFAVRLSVSMHGHQPRKRFGQHFLADPHYVARIVDAIRRKPGTTSSKSAPGSPR